MNEEILRCLEEAEILLIGIGEEFDKIYSTNNEKFKREIDKIPNQNKWIEPFLLDNSIKEEDKQLKALNILKNLISTKKHFIVSTSVTNIITRSKLDMKYVVQPCGNLGLLQCSNGCVESMKVLANHEHQYIMKKIHNSDYKEIHIGDCKICKGSMCLNNIYAINYNENGYLEQWNNYKMWLQNTLNKKVCVLELGVSMKYPTIIRWPFEKVTYFNNKARLIRINENLYQTPEELKNKGISLYKNSIDWLLELE